jgi:hypothetical protein
MVGPLDGLHMKAQKLSSPGRVDFALKSKLSKMSKHHKIQEKKSDTIKLYLSGFSVNSRVHFRYFKQKEFSIGMKCSQNYLRAVKEDRSPH